MQEPDHCTPAVEAAPAGPLQTVCQQDVNMLIEHSNMTSHTKMVLSSAPTCFFNCIDGLLAPAGRAASPRQYTPSGVIYSDKVRDLSELSTDDVAAAAEQAAQNGVPGYCADRHLRAAAGGQYCNKFDFRRGPR